MRVLEVRERTVPISRYLDLAIAPPALTTSIVAVVVDGPGRARPVVGYGFASMGRFGQGGLIRERFAPRLLAAADLSRTGSGGLDPFRAWDAMMAGEKPGGHGERCVAVGALDMALWDAAAKLEGVPLCLHLADRLPLAGKPSWTVPAYASGGYLYRSDDLAHLTDEVRRFCGMGYTRLKMKIGSAPLGTDLGRVQAALACLGSGAMLAVDAMNAYGRAQALEAARQLAPFGLWWFEDPCDPLDLETHAELAAEYSGPLGVGEAMFSAAEARLLDRYGGLRRDRDVLLFDPVHCYGLPGYLRIIAELEQAGWDRKAFWPHGGHLFCLHLVAALGLGGVEVNPRSFQPFGGLPDGARPDDGHVAIPEAPGIGFETRSALIGLFRELVGD